MRNLRGNAESQNVALLKVSFYFIYLFYLPINSVCSNIVSPAPGEQPHIRTLYFSEIYSSFRLLCGHGLQQWQQLPAARCFTTVAPVLQTHVVCDLRWCSGCSAPTSLTCRPRRSSLQFVGDKMQIIFLA